MVKVALDMDMVQQNCFSRSWGQNIVMLAGEMIVPQPQYGQATVLIVPSSTSNESCWYCVLATQGRLTYPTPEGKVLCILPICTRCFLALEAAEGDDSGLVAVAQERLRYVPSDYNWSHHFDLLTSAAELPAAVEARRVALQRHWANIFELNRELLLANVAPLPVRPKLSWQSVQPSVRPAVLARQVDDAVRAIDDALRGT